jgi:hypothetical protein
MEENKAMYKEFVTDIITTQSVILGPTIAVLKAQNIEGLVVDGGGNVIDILSDPRIVVRELISAYVDLSGEIVKQALKSVFAKYPSLYSNDSI